MAVERITIEQFGEKVLKAEGLVVVGVFPEEIEEGYPEEIIDFFLGDAPEQRETFERLARLFEKYHALFVMVDGVKGGDADRYDLPRTAGGVRPICFFMDGGRIGGRAIDLEDDQGVPKTDAEWRCLLDPYIRREFARDGAQ